MFDSITCPLTNPDGDYLPNIIEFAKLNPLSMEYVFHFV